MDNAMGDQDSSDEEQVRQEKLDAVIFMFASSKNFTTPCRDFYQRVVRGLCKFLLKLRKAKSIG